jgi:hypothetical protein
MGLARKRPGLAKSSLSILEDDIVPYHYRHLLVYLRLAQCWGREDTWDPIFPCAYTGPIRSLDSQGKTRWPHNNTGLR